LHASQALYMKEILREIKRLAQKTHHYSWQGHELYSFPAVLRAFPRETHRQDFSKRPRKGFSLRG
ncbi:hypothetical protein, partial [Microbulbifer sp. 2205BS26-8]|uniref:hypothetical protein n=1 Tax=Microbulbifer sp. 2205BS26-8 TaxID=3064386 RepID=UPI00273D9F32